MSQRLTLLWIQTSNQLVERNNFRLLYSFQFSFMIIIYYLIYSGMQHCIRCIQWRKASYNGAQVGRMAQ